MSQQRACIQCSATTSGLQCVCCMDATVRGPGAPRPAIFSALTKIRSRLKTGHTAAAQELSGVSGVPGVPQPAHAPVPLPDKPRSTRQQKSHPKKQNLNTKLTTAASDPAPLPFSLQTQHERDAAVPQPDPEAGRARQPTLKTVKTHFLPFVAGRRQDVAADGSCWLWAGLHPLGLVDHTVQRGRGIATPSLHDRYMEKGVRAYLCATFPGKSQG